LGQIIQEGEKIFFETVLHVEKSLSDLRVPMDTKNLDGLNYLADQTLDYVNEKAMEATRLAHVDGHVPNIRIGLPALTAEHYGAFLYFFCLVVALSGAASGVNPFNQPGVEAYKVNMFALLGKPGFEKEKEALLKR
jgi:glucose-6-phosphate isomerase